LFWTSPARYATTDSYGKDVKPGGIQSYLLTYSNFSLAFWREAGRVELSCASVVLFPSKFNLERE
jgi:hypothetical protein